MAEADCQELSPVPAAASAGLWMNPDMYFLEKCFAAFVLKPMVAGLASLPEGKVMPLPPAIEKVRRVSTKLNNMSYSRLTKSWKVSTIQVPCLDCDGTVEVLVHVDPTCDEPPPLFIYIHGGGYTIGDHNDSIGVMVAEALQKKHDSPCAFASVKYRLAPEHPAPAACFDVMAAFEHLLSEEAGTAFGSVRPTNCQLPPAAVARAGSIWRRCRIPK